MPSDPALVEQAALVMPPVLRSFESIHLASASSLDVDLTGIVAYGVRLCAAAADAGLSVAPPAQDAIA
ncbi:MAG: hypothetical protein ABSG09_02310 [Acidimicrobiales bacterium]